MIGSILGSVGGGGYGLDEPLALSIRQNAGLSGGLSFDGQTGGQRASANTGGGANRILSGDVTYWVRFRVGSLASRTVFAHTTTELFQGTQNIYLDTVNGQLRAVISGSAGNAIATIIGFLASYAGQVVDVHIRRVGTTLTLFLNGAQAATVTSAAAGNSLDGEFFKLGAQSSTVASVDSVIFRAAYWNRSLTDSQIAQCISYGVDVSDQWASQAGITSGSLVVGRRYRITTYIAGDDFTGVGAASNASGVEFVATATTPSWANGSTLTRIGALAAWDFETGVGLQLIDRGSNNYHAALVGTPLPSWRMPRNSGVLYAGGSFTSGVTTRLLIADALPSGALIGEVSVNITTGTPTTVSLGTLSTAPTDIVNAQAVGSGRNVVPMASRFQAAGTAQLWATFNAAATATFTIPYTITR